MSRLPSDTERGGPPEGGPGGVHSCPWTPPTEGSPGGARLCPWAPRGGSWGGSLTPMGPPRWILGGLAHAHGPPHQGGSWGGSLMPMDPPHRGGSWGGSLTPTRLLWSEAVGGALGSLSACGQRVHPLALETTLRKRWLRGGGSRAEIGKLWPPAGPGVRGESQAVAQDLLPSCSPLGGEGAS